ncbi:MAG: hypothetical protein ACE360_10625 [Hyphomicrobiales bacterium]
MKQITQHQIREGMRQAHTKRAEALAFGLQFLRSAMARGVTKIAAMLQITARAKQNA